MNFQNPKPRSVSINADLWNYIDFERKANKGNIILLWGRRSARGALNKRKRTF